MSLLVEKYRPYSLTEVIGNKEAINTLKLVLSSNTLPHLLFTGPPGTGKTTCAKILGNRLSKDLLELNASDDRGIDVVRTKIKNFTLRKVDPKNNLTNKTNPNPSLTPNTRINSYKIIILDEADSMTTAAQQALRRIMETSKDTRFILICNTFSKIYEPIQSRCAVIKFERISDTEIQQRLSFIIEKENIQVEEGVIQTISDLCEGDMRQAINTLSSVVFTKQHPIENPLKEKENIKATNITNKEDTTNIEVPIITPSKDDNENHSKLTHCNYNTCNLTPSKDNNELDSKLTHVNHNTCNLTPSNNNNGNYTILKPFKVTTDYITKITGVPSPTKVKSILNLLLQKNEEEALKEFEEIWNLKYDPVDIISAFFRTAKYLENYELIKAIGMCHVRINEGFNSKIQFYGMGVSNIDSDVKGVNTTTNI
ncbi:small subunit of replication factor C [Hamiltosporidium tvaerminnensis]|uniref:Small subunit of replication factor C n=1 Tax=Hamiltosporidium tvaerminnensis TaxID=1176355 RepID=A0A4Q9L9J4_9MICR|nr:small subunit of replication factor C [Hamiltosporidium tvaerminnensis]